MAAAVEARVRAQAGVVANAMMTGPESEDEAQAAE